MHTSVYGVLRDDTGVISINLEFFEELSRSDQASEFEEVLGGGGRRSRVPEWARRREGGRKLEKQRCQCVGVDASKYVEMSARLRRATLLKRS